MKPLVNNSLRQQSFYRVYIYAAFIGFFLYATSGLQLYYVVAITICVHQFISLYSKLGDRIPVRNLIGTMFCLNYLLSPLLLYLWLNPFAGELQIMKVDPQTYFSYAIPAIFLLIIGLNIGSKAQEEQINIKVVESVTERYPQLPGILIFIGIVASLMSKYVPQFLEQFFYIFSYLIVVGMFLSILRKGPFNVWHFLLSYGVLLFLSITSSMWSDFLNMLFFLGFFLCLRYKPSHALKIGGLFAGILLVFLIQMIKFPLRSAMGAGFNIEKLNRAVKRGHAINAYRTQEEKVLNVVSRLNQGWFFSSTISYYQQGGFDLQKGKHSVIVLQTATLPKFIAPSRINIGDPILFNKYSGHFVDVGTSMALGVLSDGFIDFGYNGIFVVFVFGLILNFFIKFYHKMNDKYLLAKVFCPLGLSYAIRPDTDTQSALGGAIKGAIILWIILVIVQKIYYQNIDDKTELSTA